MAIVKYKLGFKKDASELFAYAAENFKKYTSEYYNSFVLLIMNKKGVISPQSNVSLVASVMLNMHSMDMINFDNLNSFLDAHYTEQKDRLLKMVL